MPKTNTHHHLKPAATRLSWLIPGIVCSILLATAYYFEYARNMLPCTLCIVQRLCVTGLLFVFLLASIHRPRKVGGIIYACLGFIISLAGWLAAARQLWIQTHPSASKVCAIRFSAFQDIFAGIADCKEVHWVLWGLSLPGWMLIFFSLFILFCLWKFWRNVL